MDINLLVDFPEGARAKCSAEIAVPLFDDDIW